MCKKGSLKLADKRMAPKSCSLIKATQKKANFKFTDKRARIVTYWIHLYNQDGYPNTSGTFLCFEADITRITRDSSSFQELKKKI